jgi:hypothetical protein
MFFFFQITGGKQAKGVREYGVEEDVWVKGGGNNRKLEKTA